MPYMSAEYGRLLGQTHTLSLLFFILDLLPLHSSSHSKHRLISLQLRGESSIIRFDSGEKKGDENTGLESLQYVFFPDQKNRSILVR